MSLENLENAGEDFTYWFRREVGRVGLSYCLRSQQETLEWIAARVRQDYDVRIAPSTLASWVSGQTSDPVISNFIPVFIVLMRA